VSNLKPLLFVVCAGAAAAGVFAFRALPSHSDRIAGYRSWHKVNAKPINMEPYLRALCAGPQKWNLGNNPHDPKFFTVYVNPVGKAAMLSKSVQTFPIGSVIVKEKLPSLKKGAPELLTVMVKRERGFDTKNGDWEYFTADGKAKETSTENVAKCQSCHSGVRSNDYVFRTYVTNPPR
jgi:hypothetical protein